MIHQHATETLRVGRRHLAVCRNGDLLCDCCNRVLARVHPRKVKVGGLIGTPKFKRTPVIGVFVPGNDRNARYFYQLCQQCFSQFDRNCYVLDQVHINLVRRHPHLLGTAITIKATKQ